MDGALDELLGWLNGEGGLGPSLVLFALAAATVWHAGTRLARYADRLATATGLGGAVVGLVVLGGVTSLPEIATSTTAALFSGPTLAVNNLLGGVAFQLVVLAVADAVTGREALTSRIPRPDVLAYAAMNVLLLAIAGGFVAIGDPELFGTGFGLGALCVVAAYAACVWVARGLDRSPAWRPVGWEPAPEEAADARRDSLVRLFALLGLTAAAILAAGFVLTRTGEAIAEQAGLGAGFFGAVFLAGATSLPELSSAIGALRLKRHQMAIGDVFGGNLFDVALIALVDGLDGGGPALGQVGSFSVAVAMLGIVLCAVYVMGMVERRDRTVLRMGWDSAAVIVIYGLGLAGLYLLQGAG